ncbi:DNA-processing protein DprA [candidate division KSB1 bacterium]|nr:DNA-processing protein DprA [candidate division KSB1 bacterium]RQW11815.1 MAG: DNA-protecting protein DprA [candidate division KSB1 bacterium]
MPDHFDVADLLLLCTIPRIGSSRIRNLMARFRSPEKILAASARQLVEVDGIDQALAAQIKRGGDASIVRTQMERVRYCGVKLVSYWDENYPRLLKQVSDPPLVLYIKGQVGCLQTPAVAIVGTRLPSIYGKLMADRFARELATRDIVVVSGLARGVDTIAHRAVVQVNGATVAVLGSGVDQIYPEENRNLAEEITQRGVVLSEFAMGAKPDAPHFPRRNRIISGLSLGTVIVEAGQKSGALITADFALEQNRDVFALPGNINNPKSFGSNYLIQQGAKLVTTVEDILDEIGQTFRQNADAQQTLLQQLSDLEQLIFNALSHEPKHVDAIALQCRLPVAKALGILLTLELKNCVQQLGGKNFIRTV